MTLTIEADGSVSAAVADPPGIVEIAGLAQGRVTAALRTWKFGDFQPGLTFPLKHRILLEFSTNEGRPRYSYGRPWVEFDLNRIRTVTHPRLLNVD